MLSRDYHEFRLDDALSDAESVIANIRLGKRTEDVRFIVGHGVIRNALMSLLEGYGLSPSIQLGNRGVILCTIE